MNRRTRVLALIAAALLLLTGCSAIPASTDPVVVGPPASVPDETNEGLGIQPGGPEPGSSTDRIVRDFITALTATDIARQYLTPEAAEQWTPSDQVTVIEVAYNATPGSAAGSVTFSANRVARVDSSGGYHTDVGSHTYDFELEQIQGEWRITNPPEGLILDRDGFDALYQEASVYFADPSGTRLIPDVRYFRTNPEQRANRLVRALLNGPVSALKPGVRNELADPVQLRSAVAYSGEPITVDLGGLEDKSEGQLRILSAQLIWTLSDLGIESLRITSNGDPISIPNIGETQTLSDWAEYEPNSYPVAATAYYLNEGAVFNATTEPVDGPVGTGEYAITKAAVSVADTLDNTRIAAVSGAADPPVLRTGPLNGVLDTVDLPGTKTLTAPTWGPSTQEFWIARNGSEIIRVSADGVPKVVDTSSLGDIGKIRTIVLSRDGARLAIIAGDSAEKKRLYLSTVQATSESVSLLPPEPIAADLDVSAVAWNDARTLALLGRSSPTGTVYPYTMLVDGSQRVQLSAPPGDHDATALSAAPGRMFLCSIEGNVLRLQDSNWASLVNSVGVAGADPFYPG
ncbi:LpqB family beta-propeller domain-containing protein [Cumulibacter soli]|uniref:LpqB family beta-propeller domain-containing protein n=1 Tax=Cumulibacter soli TaxID=2546344 RepID=UPI001067D232|nr:LpqB family beta-propeller domain-containing protein [Cumulibacter soli]